MPASPLSRFGVLLEPGASVVLTYHELVEHDIVPEVVASQNRCVLQHDPLCNAVVFRRMRREQGEP